MASTIFMIGSNGDDPNYRDGDPLEVFNDRRTLIDRAQRILKPARNLLTGFTPDGGYRNFMERVSQYRFDRISKDVKRVTEIKTGDVHDETFPTYDIKLGEFDQKRLVRNIDTWDILFRYLFQVGADVLGYKAVRDGAGASILDPAGNIASYDFTLVDKKYCHLKIEVAAKLASTLPVFGSTGSETWYGGKTDYSSATTQLCWDDIENDTVLKRVDHIYMDYGVGVKKRFLCLPIVDVDDATADSIMAPLVDNTDPENPVTLKKRASECSIDSLGLSNASTGDIRDLTKIIDIMDAETDIVHSNIISLKA